jgi:hypothetical protein
MCVGTSEIPDSGSGRPKCQVPREPDAVQNRSLVMKKLSVICIALSIGLSASTAFARGGTGGAFGTSAAAPGTNSLGTALSSTGTGSPMKGPLLGTSPAVDREDAKVEKMINSICRGC